MMLKTLFFQKKNRNNYDVKDPIFFKLEGLKKDFWKPAIFKPAKDLQTKFC